MKKFIILICTLSMLFGISSPINANTIHKEQVNENGMEVRYVTPYIQEYTLNDSTGKHKITINRLNGILTIDGEEIVPTIEELPSTRATIDYSTAANYKYEVPWRGTLAAIATLLALVPGMQYSVAAAIVAFVSAEGNPLFITFTQYKSKEKYRSSYNGVYYRKACNRNFKAYKNSISNKNLIYGPKNFGWFDPVRP